MEEVQNLQEEKNYEEGSKGSEEGRKERRKEIKFIVS